VFFFFFFFVQTKSLLFNILLAENRKTHIRSTVVTQLLVSLLYTQIKQPNLVVSPERAEQRVQTVVHI